MNERKAHPRPQFIREKWSSLDGEWAFQFDDDDQGQQADWSTVLPNPTSIQVPFTYETERSTIHQEEQHSIVWYQKKMNFSEVRDYVLHFEGVDYETKVWVNGQYLGSHTGAYHRFSFDIGDFLKVGANTITVRAEDSLSVEQPRGKQRWLKENFMCWYVQTTGIWKSVWLEEASKQRLKQVKITPNIDLDVVTFEPELMLGGVGPVPETYQFEAELFYKEKSVAKMSASLTHDLTPFQMDTRVKEDANWGTKIWEPGNPHLYDVRFRLLNEAGTLLDEVTSYFGMRKISIEKGVVLLNNRELYQRLILDQGYWAESGITPPSIEALELDLEKIVEMGYNGLRKHQKIEDERFYYLCDLLGILVWAEMPSTYTFNDRATENFIDEWMAIVKQNYNHPSIITWVPFNESWGIKNVQTLPKRQDLTVGVYHLTKAIDDMRPVITNDGWQHTVSDIITLHDYEERGEVFTDRFSDDPKVAGHRSNKADLMAGEKQFNGGWFAFADGYTYQGQPIFISEFGGIAFQTNNQADWGYGHHVKNESEFMERFENIHHAIQDIPYIKGYCYTQLTDVEQEINGLLTPEREAKVSLAAVKAVNERRR